MSKFSPSPKRAAAKPIPQPVKRQALKTASSDIKRQQNKKTGTGAKGNLKVSSSGVFAAGQQGVGDSTSETKSLLGG